MLREPAQEHLVIDDEPPPTAPPRDNRAIGDGLGFVRHDEVGIDDQFTTETQTDFARAVGRVEGEVPGCEFAVTDAAMRACVLIAEKPVIHQQTSVAPFREQFPTSTSGSDCRSKTCRRTWE